MNDKASFEDLEFMLKIIGETLEVEALTKDDMFQIIRICYRALQREKAELTEEYLKSLIDPDKQPE